jgi:hypothetical protein
MTPSGSLEQFGRAAVREPRTQGYLVLAGSVEPPRGRAPRPGRSPRKRQLLGRLRRDALGLVGHPDVRRATVLRALVMPDASRGPYDVVVLVETLDGPGIGRVRASAEFAVLRGGLAEVAGEMHVGPATCVRTVGDVDVERCGLFVLQHLTSPDRATALDVWEHTTAWYQYAIGLDQSVLLEPVGQRPGQPFHMVGFSGTRRSVLGILIREFGRPSYWRHLVPYLRHRRTTVVPVPFRKA